MVVPGGTYLARDGQMRATRDGLSDPGRHHHCTASRIRSTEHRKNKGLWNPAGQPLPGAALPFAGKARSHNPCYDPRPSWRASPQKEPLVVVVDGHVGALGDRVVVDDHFRRRVVRHDTGADALAQVVGLAQR